jgi:hypothetical protein
MPSISGSFSGTITKQSGLPLSDQTNHELGIAEVSGIQRSPDPLWNDAKITYWGITDLLDGKGTQTGYYNNIHADGDQEHGTFEGKVTVSEGAMTVEGSWKITGGDGKYQGASGSGNFKTVAKSETEIEATFTGEYELAKSQSA